MEIIIICILLCLGFGNLADKKERKTKPKKKNGFLTSYCNSRAKYYKKQDKYWNGGGWYKDQY